VIDPDDSSTYDGRIVTGQNANSYVHSGLDGATQYNYVIRAETSVGGVSTSEPSVNSYTITTNSFPGGGPINPDNDTDLLVYYEFNGDLTDTRRKYKDGRYDLTAVEGATITYADSPFSENTAAYFDASNGYAYNDNLSDAAEDNLFASKSFTVSVWFYADPDMPDYSSLMSSRYVPESGNDDGNWSWQLDSDNNKLRWRAATGTKNDTEETAPTKYPAEEWSHATFVKHSDGTIEMYLNGSLIHTGVQNNTPLDVLKIGTNRREELPWKGYIDEFKIYERGLSDQEVCNLYKNHSPKLGGAFCGVESDLVAGDDHFCFLDGTTGDIKCWGDSQSGQVGTGLSGLNNYQTTPKFVDVTEEVIALSAGSQASCAVNSNSELYCWGGRYPGKEKAYANASTPTQVEDLSNVNDVEVGRQEIYAYANDRTVDGWGENQQGALGIGDTSNRKTPVDLSPYWTPKASGIGPQKSGMQSTNCFISSKSDNNQLYCMGEGRGYQMANGAQADQSTPQLISALGTGVKQVSAGENNVCAINKSKNLYCWGQETNDQFNGAGNQTTVPGSPILTDVIDVKVGGTHICAIKTNGTVSCWGNNASGQIGNGSSGGNVSTPNTSNGITNGVTLALSANTTCVLSTDDTVSCWGKNDKGQVGDGGGSSQTSPVNLGTP
jgi:alpha-tubulin suppressor-like RCC1 family protein